MAEEAPKDERTEAPTPHRREQAREKGDRLTSKELATALAGAAGALWLWSQAGNFANATRRSMTGAFDFGRADLIDFRPIEALTVMLWPLAAPLGTLAVFTIVAAILGQGITGGIGFTSSRLAPDWKRLNPIAGVKRLFGMRGLTELGKALGKAGLLGWVAYLTIKASMPKLAALSNMPHQAAIGTVADLALRLVLLLTLILAAIGAIDLPLQLRMWLQRLKMTKRDIKDEMKQQEGSPEVRHALRRMAREGLKRANSSAVSEATVVLTNPTHFAVALRYRPDEDAAPVIVARGRGVVAEAIRELAKEHGITMLSYPSVARAIYFTGKVGAPIRADLYGAVATILAFVLRVGMSNALPPPAEAPDTARFDEHGRKQDPD